MCSLRSFAAVPDSRQLVPDKSRPRRFGRVDAGCGFSFVRIWATFDSMEARTIPWPHAPTHQLTEGGTFFVTSGTYLKVHHFRRPERLWVLQRGLLTVARDFGWHVEAWAVFSNHYHFVAHSPQESPDASSLARMLGVLHARTATWLNRLDGTAGRQVWHSFWDTRLTYQRSYLARLNYVHRNPVKHGLVRVANEYPWCSARWFERTAAPAMVRSIYRFRVDRVCVLDEFEPSVEWEAEDR
jgi:putative transposase